MDSDGKWSLKEWCINRQHPSLKEDQRVCEIHKDDVWTRCELKYVVAGDRIRFLDTPEYEYDVKGDATPSSIDGGPASLQELYEGRFLWGVTGVGIRVQEQL